jgi:hypothetical protein
MEIVTCGVWMGNEGGSWGELRICGTTLYEGHGFSRADNVQVQDGFTGCGKRVISIGVAALSG